MSCVARTGIQRTDLTPHLRGDVFEGHLWGCMEGDTPRDLTGYSARIHFVESRGGGPAWRTSTEPGEGEGRLSLIDGDGRELEDGTILDAVGYPWLLQLDRQVPALPAGTWTFDVELLPAESTEPKTIAWGEWLIEQDCTI